MRAGNTGYSWARWVGRRGDIGLRFRSGEARREEIIEEISLFCWCVGVLALMVEIGRGSAVLGIELSMLSCVIFFLKIREN